MVEVARVFRKEPTPSEDILWQALRNRQVDGRKFRRQQPIGAFVLDFFCAEERLAVEVDGPIHASQREADQMRQELIESLGVRFVRIPAETVEHDLPAALSAIRAAFAPDETAASAASLPSPTGETTAGDTTLPSPLVGEGPGVRGINSLTGKTILQGYLGDYQKGEPEVAWKEFHFRLYQNRGRLGVPLSSVEGEIEREYAASLAALLPIKHQLARTDALIDKIVYDKIVYRLYGLTDEEIELIERPQFEQGLADAKAAVIADKEVTDEETAVEKIAQNILPAAQRFFERVLPQNDMARLDAELPNWRDLPPEAPIFLLTAEYSLATQPEHLDFSTSVISYSKAVETAINALIFLPFRDESGYTDGDCANDYLQEFMLGRRELTLGSFSRILRSSRETALRRFVNGQLPSFYSSGVDTLLDDPQLVQVRNAAAHDERLGRDDAPPSHDRPPGRPAAQSVSRPRLRPCRRCLCRAWGKG